MHSLCMKANAVAWKELLPILKSKMVRIPDCHGALKYGKITTLCDYDHDVSLNESPHMLGYI